VEAEFEGLICGSSRGSQPGGEGGGLPYDVCNNPMQVEYIQTFIPINNIIVGS
jgi:hypothetical protein